MRPDQTCRSAAICGLVVLNDSEDGHVVIMDSAMITARRTAASAIASKVLSCPDSRVLAILGAGVQARSHALAILHVRRIEEVRIYARTPAAGRRLRDEIS